MLPAIFGLMLLVVLAVAIVTVQEYGIGNYLAVGAVAAAALVYALTRRLKLFAGVATVVGGGALFMAVSTVVEGEELKRVIASSAMAEEWADRVRKSAGAEMGARYPLKSFGASSPDYVEYVGRVDAKIRAEPAFRDPSGKGGEVMKRLCRIAIAHELGLRDPRYAKSMYSWFTPTDPRDWIDPASLQVFLGQSAAPRQAETIARCAVLFRFRLPT